jgi:hypothetical protein
MPSIVGTQGENTMSTPQDGPNKLDADKDAPSAALTYFMSIRDELVAMLTVGAKLAKTPVDAMVYWQMVASLAGEGVSRQFPNSRAAILMFHAELQERLRDDCATPEGGTT